MAQRLSYKKAADYWANIPATIDGVLGGYGYISDVDIDGSKVFLEKVFALDNPPGNKLALDCGAGIGRVTKHLLMPRFDKVDLLEQEGKFINAAQQLIGKDNTKLGMLYHNALQKFKFDKHKLYDVIWCQWILSHINDYDVVAFLKKCSVALNVNGVIVVKENINSENQINLDEDDSSITRPIGHMIQLFEDANLKVVLTDIQEGFPKDIYAVHSFLLIPSDHEDIVVENTMLCKSNESYSEISL